MLEPGWCLILGASSGFGAAAARAFAAAGLDVAGVHLDRKATLPAAEAVRADVEAAGRRALFVNRNAVDPEARAELIEQLATACGGGPRVRVRPVDASKCREARDCRGDPEDSWSR